jgi:ribonuclease HI
MMTGSFDGACEPNPRGPMGLGWTIGDEQFHDSVPRGAENSNNVAEYLALIALLRMLKERGIIGLSVKGDSELVVMQVAGEWACKSDDLQPLCATARNLVAETKAHLFWVPRNDNTLADAMSAQGLKDQGVERPDLTAYSRRIGDIDPSVSAVAIGKKLKAAGYRDAKGHPNDKAEADGIGRRLFHHGFWTDFWHLQNCRAQVVKK